MTVEPQGVEAVCDAAAGPVFLPGDGSGYPDGSVVPERAGLLVDECGMRLISRSAVAALGEMFQGGEVRRPHVSVLWGPRGSGRATVALELARMARVNGFIPVASPLIDSRYLALFEGRSLFVIADGAGTQAWRGWLQSAIRSPRPHVFLMLSEHECRAVDGIGLKPLPADALMAAVLPHLADPRQRRRIRHAAECARGLPGRFVRLLWRRSEYSGGGLMAVRVAEHAAVYGGAERIDDPCLAVPAERWPAPDELAALRRRKDVAVCDLARGRHAHGIRQLRQTVGALARRSCWEDAAEGALALASSLLHRGRTRDAQGMLDEAREYASRSGREELLIDVATLSGEAWIDLARLDEAEAVLGATVAAARERQDAGRTAAASIALARCMYWRGQYADAGVALGGAEPCPSPPARLRRELLAARIAIGQEDTGRALALVANALGSARSTQDTRATAAAAYCAGLIRVAIGDLDAAERDMSEALAVSRIARDPLRRIRAKLLLAEIERRRGRARIAAAQVKRLARVASAVPPLVRARWSLLSALADAPQSAPEIVSRHIAASGLGALALHAGSTRPPAAETLRDDSLVHEVVAIVRACQTAEDDAVVLKDVCARLRQQVHAAAIAFVSASRGYSLLEAVGSRIDPAVAERAVTAGIAIFPHCHDDRIEAAVPVQYGGVVIGALCARWTLGSTYDRARAGPVLEMAAAAAAPVLSAALSRRDQRVPTGVELLGLTAAMDELRHSVERAAAAPFSTLIDGESGSGKELVARAIHRLGPRRDRPFCTLNCAALPDELIEAELFGHARGAFTGAVVERAGVFEEAHAGTLFLDEIGELSPRAQAKVLRVIQEGELRRVGENISRRIDVRIVAATNRDLRQEVDAGRFRLDLLYRLDVIRITVPPLRDRREDIAMLAEHFWRESTRRLGSRAALSTATLAALARYDWPGNVRELQNVLAALAVRSPKRGVVPPTALPPHIVGRARGETWTLTDARRTFDERFIRAALVRTGGHRGRAAAELGVTRQGLTKLMGRLGIGADC
jgi:DNA-binding NtrC family response regulator/tetratricopeptide (TPR) repeat protein